MNKINIHNYEAFLLDHFEGRLDAASTAELEAFAMAHPMLEIAFGAHSLPWLEKDKTGADFKDALKKAHTYSDEIIAYLEGMLSPEEKNVFEKKLESDHELSNDVARFRKTILLQDKDEKYPGKEKLYRKAEEAALNNRYIAYLENMLAPAERRDFEAALQENNELRKEFSNWSKTKLRPDLSEAYPDKPSLKKKSRVIALFSLRTATAVAAAFLLLLGLTIVLKQYSNPDAGDIKPVALLATGTKPLPETLGEKITGEPVAPGASRKEPPVKQNHSVPGKEQVVRQVEEVNVEQVSNVAQIANVAEEESTEIARSNNLLPAIKEERELVQANVEHEPVLVPLTGPVENTHHYTVQIEEGEDGEIPARKRKFWKRAVKIAREANRLGLKSIDGEEDSREILTISFNSFSIEKK
jgi:uncharacterized protein YbcI